MLAAMKKHVASFLVRNSAVLPNSLSRGAKYTALEISMLWSASNSQIGLLGEPCELSEVAELSVIYLRNAFSEGKHFVWACNPYGSLGVV